RDAVPAPGEEDCEKRAGESGADERDLGSIARDSHLGSRDYNGRENEGVSRAEDTPGGLIATRLEDEPRARNRLDVQVDLERCGRLSLVTGEGGDAQFPSPDRPHRFAHASRAAVLPCRIRHADRGSRTMSGRSTGTRVAGLPVANP